MSASAEEVARLRRMVAEPTTATYSDAALAVYIERYPLPDSMGRDPYQVAATVTPSLEVNPDWSATYDLNAAASDIWSEKVSALSTMFNFSEDGQSFQRAQMFKQAQQQMSYYRARRSARPIQLRPDFLQPSDAVPTANRTIPLAWF